MTQSKARNHLGQRCTTPSCYYTGGKEYFLEYAVSDPTTKKYVEKFYRFIEPDTGPPLPVSATSTNPGSQHRSEETLTTNCVGVTTGTGATQENMEEADKQGRICARQNPARVPRFKRYLDEMQGQPIGYALGRHRTRSGPSAMNVSAIRRKSRWLCSTASSKPAAATNDIVLDAFCGCGTALVAAQKLKRQWIGIDRFANGLPRHGQATARCLQDDEDEKLLASGQGFVVRDLPWTEGSSGNSAV